MRHTGPDATTVRLVRERDQWRCARCAGWGPLSTQHRVARGMGGTRLAWVNLPANLLTLCGDGTRLCHGWVESHPEWANLHGYASPRARRVPPVADAVWTWRGWVRLDNTGAVVPLPEHPGVAGCGCGCRPTTPTADLWALPELNDH